MYFFLKKIGKCGQEGTGLPTSSFWLEKIDFLHTTPPLGHFLQFRFFVPSLTQVWHSHGRHVWHSQGWQVWDRGFNQQPFSSQPEFSGLWFSSGSAPEFAKRR